MINRLYGPLLVVCLFPPGTGLAQEPPIPIKPPIPEAKPLPPDAKPLPPADPVPAAPLIHRPDWEEVTTGSASPGRFRRHFKNWDVGIDAGPGKAQWHSGFPYGPAVAPPWGYYGLAGGPYVTYPWGWPGYSARAGHNWSNGLSLYGPPVPVYGPIPGVMGNGDLVKQWHDVPSLGIGYGWFGVYAASPRPRPLTVSAWPVIVESVPGAGCPNGANCAAAVAPAAPTGGCLILSVKVPQQNAEVFVDGVKTAQTGTDRLFESPALEAGKAFQYQLTARWTERGVTHEKTKLVTGTPGEVVRVDFTAPEIVVTGK